MTSLTSAGKCLKSLKPPMPVRQSQTFHGRALFLTALATPMTSKNTKFRYARCMTSLLSSSSTVKCPSRRNLRCCESLPRDFRKPMLKCMFRFSEPKPYRTPSIVELWKTLERAIFRMLCIHVAVNVGQPPDLARHRDVRGASVRSRKLHW